MKRMNCFQKCAPLTALVLATAMCGGAFAAPGIKWHQVKSTIWWPKYNTALDAWEPYKTNNPKETVDQHLTDPALQGAIDLHAHHGPDSYPRYGDAFEIAKLMNERGMRGAVFKNHWQDTASIAYLVRKYATQGTGFLAFGAICMDSPEGGINVNAVRYMADVTGGYGQVVWMPTHDSENEVKYLKQARPFVRVSNNGKLVPEVGEVLDLIAQRNLTLATGHVSAEEMVKIVRAAAQRGIKKIIITHADLGPQYTNPTVAQLKKVIKAGAYVEIVSGQTRKAEIIIMMHEIGAEHIVVSSDSGLPGTNHTDALVNAARNLRTAGFTEAELNLMFKDNPAKALGLAVIKQPAASASAASLANTASTASAASK
jgi:hypothetical protein